MLTIVAKCSLEVVFDWYNGVSALLLKWRLTIKLFKTTALLLLASFIASPLAFAHVVVTPSEALTSSFQTFSMSVPNEQEQPTTKLKLVIPSGLQYVSPTVKNGWTITTDKTGEGESAVVKSITWDGGSIPAGLRDDFTFSAKVPEAATNLNWKAYQTYEDGTTVSWDQKPTASESDDDSAATGPYSVTAVKASIGSSVAQPSNSTTDNSAKYISIAAAAVALLAFAAATRKSAGK